MFQDDLIDNTSLPKSDLLVRLVQLWKQVTCIHTSHAELPDSMKGVPIRPKKRDRIFPKA